MAEKLETSKTTGAHAQLARLEGTWEGTASVWFDPSKVEDESPVKGTIKPLMDGKYMLHEYQGSFGGKPITGMALIGYNLDTQKYQCAWVDSFHTGTAIMFSEGQKAAKELSVTGSYAYVTPETEQHWGWRTTIEFNNNQELVLTAYNTSPDGEEAKATETVYKKVL
ncbi:DUF1579 domain-containing protein [Rufibacter sp. LB8]|uniref:DUF1579 domain-containing protein n=1 Tax=Rufibacter sp. LB8 TaxID=2777781 RepID=UPI00178C5D5C|nr:DUF1579 domain-containing protein [Rufibacter sp. LB8]